MTNDYQGNQVLTRLRQAVNANSDSELARALGVTAQAVSKAKTSARVPSSWIRDVAEQYNVMADWLFFGRGPMRSSSVTTVSLNYDPAWPNGMVQEDAASYGEATHGSLPDGGFMVYIPKVVARLAAGTGSLETDNQVEGYYGFRSDWIYKKGIPARMVLMDITGDSMQPLFNHGDTVLIDQSKTEIYGHGYFAVGVEDAIFIKQLDLAPGKLILRSLNPLYAPIEVDLRIQEAQVRIIGRAVWTCRELI